MALDRIVALGLPRTEYLEYHNSQSDYQQVIINPMSTQQEIIEYYKLQLENPRNQDVDDAFGDVDDEMDQDYSQDDEIDQGFSL